MVSGLLKMQMSSSHTNKKLMEHVQSLLRMETAVELKFSLLMQIHLIWGGTYDYLCPLSDWYLRLKILIYEDNFVFHCL